MPWVPNQPTQKRVFYSSIYSAAFPFFANLGLRFAIIALGQPIILSQQAFLCQRVKSTGIFMSTG